MGWITIYWFWKMKFAHTWWIFIKINAKNKTPTNLAEKSEMNFFLAVPALARQENLLSIRANWVFGQLLWTKSGWWDKGERGLHIVEGFWYREKAKRPVSPKSLFLWITTSKKAISQLETDSTFIRKGHAFLIPPPLGKKQIDILKKAQATTHFRI